MIEGSLQGHSLNFNKIQQAIRKIMVFIMERL